jgi:hypothetical protein
LHQRLDGGAKMKAEFLAILDYELEYDEKDLSSVNPRHTGTTFIGKSCDVDQRKRFYRALLELDWLPRKVQYAVAGALGTSVRRRQRDREAGSTAVIRHQVAEYMAQLCDDPERPRGGIYNAALEEIAERLGMSVETLEQRLTRNARRQRKAARQV